MLCSVKTKANVRYVSACGPGCSEIGDQTLVCPKCKYFIWHANCLLQEFSVRKLPQPLLSGDKWLCIHCVLRESLKTNLWFNHLNIYQVDSFTTDPLSVDFNKIILESSERKSKWQINLLYSVEKNDVNFKMCCRFYAQNSSTVQSTSLYSKFNIKNLALGRHSKKSKIFQN